MPTRPLDFKVPFVFSDGESLSLHFDIEHVQSRMSLHDPVQLMIRYSRTSMGFLLFNLQPERIAVIGLGGGSMPKFLYQHLPETQIDVVEANPFVIQLRQQFCIPDDEPRFRVHRADGIAYIQQQTAQLDVLIIDAFDHHGLPKGFATEAFFRSCLAALRPGGVAVINIPEALPKKANLLAKIQRAFGKASLIVGIDDPENAVAFGFNTSGDDAGDGSSLPAALNPQQLPAGLRAALGAELQTVYATWATASATAGSRSTNRLINTIPSVTPCAGTRTMCPLPGATWIGSPS